MKNIEEHKKIESTLLSFFKYNHITKKCFGDNILLKQILDEIELYLKWLDGLKIQYNIKNMHTIEHIAEQVFSPITKSTFKCHIEAYFISTKGIKDDLMKLCENNDNIDTIKVSDHSNYIKGILSLLNDLILDFNEIHWQIEEYFLKNPPKVKSGRRRIFMGREIFRSSQDIVRRLVSYDTISYSSVSIFLLRQSIEVTTLRALGIYSFVDNKDNEIKFKLDKIFKFMNKNKKYIKFPVNSSILKKIIKWSNPYVHKGIMHLHWQIIIAQKALLPLFIGGKDRYSTSIHGAIKINKQFYKEKLHQELKVFLAPKKEVKIIKLDKPDCLLTDDIFEN